MTIDSAINTIKEGTPDKESIKFLLELDNKADQERLFSEAYEIKVQNVGKKVYFRGIIEFSNICEKNCYYCGVRRGNRNVKRYQMTEDQALKAAMWSFENKFGSVVIQAGERTDRKYVDLIERIVRRIKEESQGKLGITLSLGEQA
ncbi:MAG: radical SAM protein, partial [Bacillota bacterium]